MEEIKWVLQRTERNSLRIVKGEYQKEIRPKNVIKFQYRPWYHSDEGDNKLSILQHFDREYHEFKQSL